jgi:hypothetical protein
MDVAEYLLQLGSKASQAIGYTGQQMTFMAYQAVYRPTKGVRVRKDQELPMILVGKRTITIQQPNYVVTFFVLDEPLSRKKVVTCTIHGTIDTDILDRILTIWQDADICNAYEEKAQWLAENTEYQRPVKDKIEAKNKLHPRQLEL